MEALLDGARIWQIWQGGGWVMIPLLLLSVLLYSQAIQLVLYVRRTRIERGEESNWRDWVNLPEKAGGHTRDIIEYTQSDVSSAAQIRLRFDEIRSALVHLIDRRTRFVGTLVAAAPLMGLLGTVLGMLQTFLGISTSGGGETAGVVAAGISEALFTTQTGLIIALPGLFLVMMIQRQRQALVGNLARLESLTLTRFKFD